MYKRYSNKGDKENDNNKGDLKDRNKDENGYKSVYEGNNDKGNLIVREGGYIYKPPAVDKRIDTPPTQLYEKTILNYIKKDIACRRTTRLYVPDERFANKHYNYANIKD